MNTRKSTEQKLRDRVSQWAKTIGVKPKVVQVRHMKRKWASCSTAGRVSFSKDLATKRAKFQDFVILHELMHLHVPNHGKLFKSLMTAYMPDWEEMDMER
jgi:predicted metal-dependent hydrolase